MTGRRMAMLMALAWASVLPAAAQVTSGRLLNASREPQSWLTYSGNYSGWRYSELSEINTRNVPQLRVEWVFQTGVPGQVESTPIVADGMIYITAANNNVFALDARTGRQIWRYQRRLPSDLRICCGPEDRGVAVLGDKVLLGTLDAHVVALDAKTGNVIWDVEAADYSKGYSFTVPPLAVKDKIILGVAGGEYGIRGFIDAYEAETGKRAWRFYTIPGPGEPGNETWEGDSWKTGGAPAWVTGTYDPALNLTYWGIGNPGPDADGEVREGDNLYSDCIVALDVDTGKLKWYFQPTPHDTHDWDATQTPLLVDAEVGGRPRKLLLQANRNGFFFVLDRETGQFLHAKPFVHTTWAKQEEPNGRPVALPGTDPSTDGTYICPDVTGGTNWFPPSFSPQTGLVYVPARERCAIYYTSPQDFREGDIYWGSTGQAPTNDPGWGALRAIDPQTAEIKWEFKQYSPPRAGTMATAGGLVFAGNAEGYLLAFDARSGKELWHIQTGAPIVAAPATVLLNGKQHVLLAAGGSLFAFALP